MVKRGFVDIKEGQIHYRFIGDKAKPSISDVASWPYILSFFDTFD